nr:prolipoprotein diacylglyceryl transferase [Vallitalea okinawensis]
MPDIWFPNLNIEIDQLDPIMVTVFGIDIYWYGFIIAMGVIAGLVTAMTIAKKTKQNPETYIDVLIVGLIAAIIGARLYYVIFSWDLYKDNLLGIFNLRQGGLAIYGGVIGALIAVGIYAKVKHMNFLQIIDTAGPGLIIGQAVGRWGNFFNQEAFGGYTDNLFAMRLKVENVRYLPETLMDTMANYNGVDYIQVHPTFLYESIWNLGVYILLLIFWKYKKFEGEVFLLYLFGYGLGRVWIEGLRTDQLLIGGSSIAVSQVLSGILILFSISMIIYNRNKCK